MREVMLAKSAGFCYGVRRAVELARRTAEGGGNCWMLGDLIHNRFVVEDLARRGIRKTADSALVPCEAEREESSFWPVNDAPFS